MKQENALWCIDWDEAAIELWGTMGAGNYGSFEFVLFPCNQGLSYFGASGKDLEYHPDCIADKQQQIDYLGSPNLLVYHNMESIVVNQFGENRISKYSTIQNI